MGFFGNLFNGSKEQQKSEAEQYSEYLLSELEKVKNEKEEALEQERLKYAELQKKIEQEQEEKEQLKTQIQSLKEEIKEEQNRQDLKQKEIQLLREKLKDYESGYRDLSKYLSAAKKDADILVAKAKEKSDDIVYDAKADADRLMAESKQKSDEYRQQIERELEQKKNENEEKFTVAKYQLREYLNSFNRVQKVLVENYNELGELIERMPLRLEDIFSEEPLELLRERNTERGRSRREVRAVKSEPEKN